MRTTTEISAGGIVYQCRDGMTQIVLIRVGERWCLPKGQVEEGESLSDAARREIREETGLEGRIEQKLGDIRYWYTRRDEHGHPLRVAKRVHYYKVAYVGGHVGDHDHEVDEARWFPLETGLRILQFDNERDLARKIAESNPS